MLSTCSILVALLFVTGFDFSFSYTIVERVDPSAFDVLIFTQQWPQTACLHWKQGGPKHTCTLPGHDTWTIHGLWPTKYHTLGPNFCDKSKHFDQHAIESIEPELTRKWTNIEVETSHYSFWKHEYEKHGTCAAALPSLDTERKYFESSLKLLDTYNMQNVLYKARIYPGKSYRVQDVIDGVTKVLGKSVQIECIQDRAKKNSYISEIRICFDKQLRLTNCDGIIGFPTNCDHSKLVMYPKVVPAVNVRG